MKITQIICQILRIKNVEAKTASSQDSVLVRMVQRGRLERVAQASRGRGRVALSYETALVVYGISDTNPAMVHLTVPATRWCCR